MARTFGFRNTSPGTLGSWNDYKKDKMNMVKRNNEKISMREFDEADFNDHQYKSRLNVDRIMLERQMTAPNFGDNESIIGEVTGERFDGSDVYDKGMPVRSSFTVKRAKYDNNSHLDFDLFDKIEKKQKNNVQYNDTTSGDYAQLDDAMKTITRGVDPYQTCITDVNTTTCWLHGNMYMFTKEDYVMNGYGMFSAFGIIYLMSHGNTEIELKNYFGFQDKKHLNAGLLTIRETMNKFRNQVVMDNYIVNDRNVPSQISTAKKLKSLIFNVIINRQYPEQEAERINKIIKTVSGMDNTVSANTLTKSAISLITVAKLMPIWGYRIDNIVKIRFRNTLTNFIRFVGKTFDYYEDAERQLVEIPLSGDVLTIGIILLKQNLNSPTDLKSLSTAINYIKPTVLDEVLIPTIKKRYKTRLNKTLQKTGLNVVFSAQEMTGLYPDGGTIDDALQYIDVIWGTKTGNKRCDNKGYRTTRKFIANRSFEFYLRNTENNCIVMMGRY
jgi:serine protease inhibitor